MANISGQSLRIKALLNDLDQSGWIGEQVGQIREALGRCDMAAVVEQIGAFDGDIDLHKRRLSDLRRLIMESCEAALAKSGAQ